MINGNGIDYSNKKVTIGHWLVLLRFDLILLHFIKVCIRTKCTWQFVTLANDKSLITLINAVNLVN